MYFLLTYIDRTKQYSRRVIKIYVNVDVDKETGDLKKNFVLLFFKVRKGTRDKLNVYSKEGTLNGTVQ